MLPPAGPSMWSAPAVLLHLADSISRRPHYLRENPRGKWHCPTCFTWRRPPVGNARGTFQFSKMPISRPGANLGNHGTTIMGIGGIVNLATICPQLKMNVVAPGATLTTEGGGFWRFERMGNGCPRRIVRRGWGCRGRRCIGGFGRKGFPIVDWGGALWSNWGRPARRWSKKSTEGR
jgi:hypothetical protein